MRGDLVLRIKALLGVKNFHLRKELRIAMSLDESQLGLRQLLLDYDRLVLGTRPEAVHARLQIVVIQIQPVGDGPQVLRLQSLAGQQDAVGGMVVHDHASIPVEDLTARRHDRDCLDAIQLGALAVEIRIANLDAPEARDEEQEDPHRQVLKEGDFLAGYFRIVANERLVGNSLRQIGLYGAKTHKARGIILIPSLADFTTATLSETADRSNPRVAPDSGRH